MYVYVNKGRADNWKEALNLYYEAINKIKEKTFLYIITLK